MKSNISIFIKFLLFSSGATLELISTCPKFEINKYASIGLTILFTAILSVLSSYFAFSLIFESNSLAILLALFWGCIIFNLDRYIVSSMRMNEGKTKEILKAIPRLLIALLIATVISKPLEIKLFSSEINTFLNKEKIELSFQTGEKYKQDLENINAKKENIALLFREKELLRDKYYEDYKCECNGTCGTKVKGKGEECNSRKERYELHLKELEASRKEKDSLLEAYGGEEIAIKELISSEKNVFNKKSFGFFDQVRALNEIDKFSSLFIFLIFVMIEIAPILTKLLSRKGPYDNLILEHEMKFEAEYLKKLDAFNNDRVKNRKLTEMSAELELKSKEKEINNLLKKNALERYEKMRKQIDNKNDKI